MQVRLCSGYLKPQYSGEELRVMAMERRRKATALHLASIASFLPDYEPTDGGE